MNDYIEILMTPKELEHLGKMLNHYSNLVDLSTDADEEDKPILPFDDVMNIYHLVYGIMDENNIDI
jgi:hypothetical protein